MRDILEKLTPFRSNRHGAAQPTRRQTSHSRDRTAAELLEHAQHFEVPRGMVRLHHHHSFIDQFHRQHPACFFPVCRISVPDDGCYALVLIGCALRY
jgi:hypothetical protein